MSLPWDIISDDARNVSKVLNDLINTADEKDVSWIVKNEDGSVSNVTIPNTAKLITAMNEGLMTYIESNTVSVEDATNILNDAIDVMNASLDSSTVDLTKIVNDSITDANTNLDITITDITNLVNSKVTEINDNLSKAIADITKLIEDGLNGVRGNLTTVSDATDSTIVDLTNTVNSNIDTNNKNLSDAIDENTNLVNNSVAKLQDTFDSVNQNLLNNTDASMTGVSNNSITITTPIILTPTEGESSFIDTIISSEYITSDIYLGIQDYVEWQLSTDIDFNTRVDSYIGSDNLSSWTPNYGNNVSTIMYIRVRYGSDNHISGWSDSVSFVTPDVYIETPVITSPTPDSEALSPVFTYSTFNVINGDDTLVSVDFELSTVSDFSTVSYSYLNDTENLTSFTLPDTLDIDSTYYVRVRYNGETYVSAYGIYSFITRSKTDTPVLSGDTIEYENSDININIDNYDSTFTYVITVPSGDVVRTDSNIVWTLPTVDEDTTFTLTIYAEDTVNNLPVSDTVYYGVTDKNIPIVDDQTLVFDDVNIFDTFNILYGTGKDTLISTTDYDTRNIIDTDNTSTTTEIYIDNKLVDMNVGDRMVSDTGETFTVSIVNNDGTTATIDAIAIACGDYHTVVIKNDNSVWSIGRNNYGQLGNGTTTDSVSWVNSGISAIDIACGYAHTVVIKDDNSVWGVGNNGYGELGDGTTSSRSNFVDSGISAIAIACGYKHTTVIKDDNSVWSVGYNNYGQLGDGTTDNKSNYVDSGINAIDIACGIYYTAIIKDDNTVWSVGYNAYGQLGDGTTDDSVSWVDSGISAIAIAIGSSHTVVIKDDNSVWSVGYNNYGQLGDGTTTNRSNYVDSGINAIDIACGYYHTVVIKDDNSILGIGYNHYGQLGDGTTTDSVSWVNSNMYGIDIIGGKYHTVVIKNDNSIWTTGRNDYGQLGDGTTTDRNIFYNVIKSRLYYPNYWITPTLELTDAPTIVQLLEHKAISDDILQDDEDGNWAGINDNTVTENTTDIIDTINTSTTTEIYIDNKLVNMNVGDRMVSDTGETFTVSIVNNDGTTATIDAKVVAAGSSHTVIIKDDNSVWSIGNNYYGQLGDGTTTDSVSWVDSGISAIDIACDYGYTVVIKDDDTVWAIGRNYYGQLGDGTTTNSTSWVDSGISGVHIVGGGNHICILKDDNTVWAVGNNDYGQLGDGTTTSRSNYVDSGISAIAIACGYAHTVVIKDDNSVWSVGYNAYGQLGDGTTDSSTSWVDSGISAIAIACGDSHTVVIKDDNSVWSVGYNNYGQLGDGTTTDNTSWVDSGISAIAIACGGYYTTVIKDDNTVWSVGSNAYGQLGDGTTTDNTSWVDSGISAIFIICGATYTVVIKDNNILLSVGGNDSGQLGDGTTTNSVSWVDSGITSIYYPNYWITPTLELNTVPTNVYPISKYFINDTEFIPNSITYDTGILNYTMDDVVFDPTIRDIRFITNLNILNQFTYFSGMLAKED